MSEERPPAAWSDLMRFHYTGPKGETLFHTPYSTLTPSPSQQQATALLDRLGAGKDDRSMALLSALVCEKYLDRILGLVMPRYKPVLLADNASLTFSTKINILRAFDIIPRHITKAAGFLRAVRNKFAHELDLNELSELPEKLQKEMKDYYASRVTNAQPEDIDDPKFVFNIIVYHATSVLISYETSVTQLNKTIRDPSFESMLSANSERIREIAIQYLMANPVQSGMGTPDIGGVSP